MDAEDHSMDIADLGVALELDGTLLHLPERPVESEALRELPPEVPTRRNGAFAPPAPALSVPPPLATGCAREAGTVAAWEAGGLGTAPAEPGEAQLAAACEPPPGAELPAPPEAWRPGAAAGCSFVLRGGGSLLVSGPAEGAEADHAADAAVAAEVIEAAGAAEAPEDATEAVFLQLGGTTVAEEARGAVAESQAEVVAGLGGREATGEEAEGNGELAFVALADSLAPRCLDLDAEESQESGPECMLELRRERAALLEELCRLKAKFELTLEIFRSILHLDVGATWADIIERCEALAQSGGTDSACSTPLPLIATDADLERERLEENLEAQAAYNIRLRQLLEKQQVLLDMSAQLPQQNVDARAECEMLMHKLQGHQEEMSQQDAVVRQQAEQIAILEAALGEERRQLLADRKLRETEGNRLRADSERKRAEVRELVETLAVREDLVERLRGQLSGHEAAERRKRMYHASRNNSGVGEDTVSDYNSSVGSGRTSAVTSARGPTRTASEQDGPSAAVPKPERPLEDMGRDERDAFLSQFPMSSRTERHLRNRLDDRRRRPGVGT